MTAPNLRADWRLIESRDPYPSNLAIILGKNMGIPHRGVHVFTRYEGEGYRYKFERESGMLWAHADGMCPEFLPLTEVYDASVHYLVMVQDRQHNLAEVRMYDRYTHTQI